MYDLDRMLNKINLQNEQKTVLVLTPDQYLQGGYPTLDQKGEALRVAIQLPSGEAIDADAKSLSANAEFQQFHRQFRAGLESGSVPAAPEMPSRAPVYRDDQGYRYFVPAGVSDPFSQLPADLSTAGVAAPPVNLNNPIAASPMLGAGQLVAIEQDHQQAFMNHAAQAQKSLGILQTSSDPLERDEAMRNVELCTGLMKQQMGPAVNQLAQGDPAVANAKATAMFGALYSVQDSTELALANRSPQTNSLKLVTEEAANMGSNLQSWNFAVYQPPKKKEEEGLTKMDVVDGASLAMGFI